jgi:hypothetical protein
VTYIHIPQHTYSTDNNTRNSSRAHSTLPCLLFLLLVASIASVPISALTCHRARPSSVLMYAAYMYAYYMPLPYGIAAHGQDREPLMCCCVQGCTARYPRSEDAERGIPSISAVFFFESAAVPIAACVRLRCQHGCMCRAMFCGLSQSSGSPPVHPARHPPRPSRWSRGRPVWLGHCRGSTYPRLFRRSAVPALINSLTYCINLNGSC